MVVTVEYRIPLPMTRDEYRIAQLYMLSKKSREESRGEDSGIEILMNEPYTDGPGPNGCGQYTRKVYYVGSHLPAWMKTLIPKSALAVEEEAWNAYPYTKTKFTCPFIEKFCIEVETFYFNDGGHQENVFNLSKMELKQREIDVINIVRDQLPVHEYDEDEDPKKFISHKTLRGPLDDDWINEYWNECEGRDTPLPNGKAIMCAYKLCKVEFRYWGMQNKIEKFIHDIALRKTMLRAHRQAWSWLDEWWGLTIDDIRSLEKETQALLAEKYCKEDEISTDEKLSDDNDSQIFDAGTNASNHSDEVNKRNETDGRSVKQKDWSKRSSFAKNRPRNTLSSQVNMRMESIRRESINSLSDDEFFDCLDDKENSIHKWSSLEILPQEDVFLTASRADHFESPYEQEYRQRLSTEPYARIRHVDRSVTATPPVSPSHYASCPSSILVLVVHAGSVLDKCSEVHSKKSDVTTFKCSFELVIRQHYPHLVGRVAIKLIEAPSVFTEVLDILSSLSPLAVDLGLNGYASNGDIPVSALPLLGTLGTEYDDAVFKLVHAMNGAYSDFVHTEGQGFNGQICLVGDSVGGLMCYDALTNFHERSFREKISPGQYRRHERASNAPHSCFLQPHHDPFQPPHSPSIMVSQHEAKSRFGCYTNPRSSYGYGLYPRSCPISPECPLTPPRLPIRKISDPLIACSTGSSSDRKSSAPSSLSGLPSHVEPPAGGQMGASHLDCLSAAHVRCHPLHKHSTDHDSLVSATRPHWYDSGDDMTHSECFRKVSSSDAASQDSVFSDRRSGGHLSVSKRLSSGSSDRAKDKIQFDVNGLFLFGCPLALVLVHRKLINNEREDSISRPSCDQVYNLFHPTDPMAVRLEPLISARFSLVDTVKIPRYGKYPLGDGHTSSLLDCVQSKGGVFQEPVSNFATAAENRRFSDTSMASCVSGGAENLVFINALSKRWWGTKRLDYSLYCPEGLSNFPSNSLPHVFHASYWESMDVIAFILRQLVKLDSHEYITAGKEISPFQVSVPREKWLRKRTSVKVKNIAANHRGNDIISKKGVTQEIQARFIYGPLDMVALTGEKVDLHVMKNPPGGNWDLVGTTITDKNGKISFPLPKNKQLNCGIFPVKAIVRGDHSVCSLYLAVIPAKMQCVVFSIDGSFTASVSVTGKDPKVRAGAVDVVRHWQELGYLIIYVTGRPDMQKRKVVSWLAQHVFPHGLVSFADGISTDPLGHKTDFLKSLVQDCEMIIEAGYGSAKDIPVYSNIGLKPSQIYIVGKTSKKQHSSCQVLSGGYAAHLAQLSSMEISNEAKTSPEMVLHKYFFELPGCNTTVRKRRWAKRTTSHPVLSSSANEGILQARTALHSTSSHSSSKGYKH